ncbi:MAG: hypothetical protein KDM91_20310, partial [Verrucomicrobiae bacterium]|nr:hypothetical protein [Verrucomicrobiae bacterium]
MNEAGSIAAAAPSAVSTASIGQLAGRYLAAFRKMFTPKIIFRAIWNTIRRRLLISLVVAPFIYGLAAIYHVYLQAKAGGWNETAGKLIGPDDLAGPGARWFAGAMMFFGAVSFARGMGLRIVKFTAGALKVSPSGFGYALAQIKANIRRPAVYERLLMVGGGAAVLGDVAMRVGWSLRKFVLLGAVASVLAGFRAAHDQRQKPPGAPLEQQPWLLALAASAGFLLSYLYYGFYATAALVIGVVLWYRRTRTKPPGPPPSAPTSGQTAGWLFAIALILSLGSAPPAWADDGGWDEYSPQGGGEKTFGGYLQTPDGRKVVEFGLLGGGFATAGALLGILLGGTLADAFQQALLRGAGTETAEGEGTEPPDDSLPWQVTAPDGRIHRFGTREEAQAFCDRLVNQENIHQAENDYRNAVEQIGFLESVRQGLVKAGRDTTSQDREIARWKAERDRLHSQVDRMGGSTSYTARQRTSWTFGEHDALIQKQQEERELLNDIHKTSKAIRNLADKDQLQYGEGQADKMLEHLNRMSENLAFGKGEQPSREELDRLQNLLRHELDAEKSRVEARNTDWVKEGAQATSREIFTGRNADGETSYKAMVLRGLIGGATGGQSEYVFEVGDKMYIVHDEVMAGKSGLEAFQTAATRVVTDEIKGRAIQKGLAVTAKAGQVGFEATLAGTKMGDTLTNAAKSTGDFLSQDIRTTLRTGGREMGEGTGNILGKTDIEIPAKAGGGGVEIPSRTEVELPGKPGVEVPTRTDVEVPSKADVEVPTKVEA